MSSLKKSIVVNIILIMLAVVVSYRAARMARDAFITRAQSEEMIRKIDQLKQKKQELEAALAHMQTKETVEREAKARLNLKKIGEEVVVVVPEKKDNASVQQPASIWSKLTSFFK